MRLTITTTMLSALMSVLSIVRGANWEQKSCVCMSAQSTQLVVAGVFWQKWISADSKSTASLGMRCRAHDIVKGDNFEEIWTPNGRVMVLPKTSEHICTDGEINRFGNHCWPVSDLHGSKATFVLPPITSATTIRRSSS